MLRPNIRQSIQQTCPQHNRQCSRASFLHCSRHMLRVHCQATARRLYPANGRQHCQLRSRHTHHPMLRHMCRVLPPRTHRHQRQLLFPPINPHSTSINSHPPIHRRLCQARSQQRCRHFNPHSPPAIGPPSHQHTRRRWFLVPCRCRVLSQLLLRRISPHPNRRVQSGHV